MASISEEEITLRRMLWGFRLSALIATCAKLGLADVLHGSPQSAKQLAQRLSLDNGALERLLEALVATELLARDRSGNYQLTGLSDFLRTDHERSLHAAAALVAEEWCWLPWAELAHSVKTGQAAFEHIYEKPIFDYLGEHPAASDLFNRVMASASWVTEAVARQIDFSGVNELCDIGGGKGALMIDVLKQNPALRGCIFDLPHVASEAQTALDIEGLSDRCTISTGSFFEQVPEAECYIMKYIIHDWDDARALKILQNCRAQIKENGRLFLIESVILDGVPAASTRLVDITMLLNTGGKERTEAEYSELLRSAGFSLQSVRELISVPIMHAIEARAV